MGDAIPVETGHELVLATLLVHFEVDVLEQLPTPLRQVAQDVYDIASDLAATKVAFQRKAATLAEELACLRADLLTARTANAVASSSRAAKGPTPVAPRAPAPDKSDERMCAAVAMQVPAPPRKSKKLRWSSSTRVESGCRATSHRGLHAAPATIKPGVQAYHRWVSAPARMVVRPQIAHVAPLPTGIEPAPTNPKGPLPCRLATSSTKKKTYPTREHASQTQTENATSSQGTQQPTPATKLSVDLRQTPAPSSNVKQSPHTGVQKCLQMQVECERRVHTMQRKFGQIALWQPTFRDGRLVVRIPHSDGIMKCARAHSADDIRAALEQLCDEVEELRSDCVEALQRVSKSSGYKPWLEARHGKLADLLSDVDRWIEWVATLLNKVLIENVFSGVAAERPTAVMAVWNAISGPDTLSFFKTAGEKHDLHRTMPASWRPLTVFFVEYAISSFLVRALEVYAVHGIPGLAFDTLRHVGEAARHLEDIYNGFQLARIVCRQEHSRVDAWSGAFMNRYAKALRSIQQRATACSQAICEAKPDRRDPWNTSSPHAPESEAPASFPADRYSWEVYEDVAIAIVSCHVALTRLHEVPANGHMTAKQWIITRLRTLEEVMAPWADPRFSDDTNARLFERSEYLKLIRWCDTLREIVACHDKPTE